ncbi:RDD family protein [Rhodovastum atsumiense]|uniref:RDD family protein n=1 Tax=Rhodovastum atsumiense TaxID=504468 RepID=A0A5M6IP74_9PROT|nr:RDD family protein [Rhodovastum atsumiense]KAA5609358.1 RDD family protein [Rhodovastum atsumiense]CAH2598567.1 RDD family protein [Rhodovastum atsumiense]
MSDRFRPAPPSRAAVLQEDWLTRGVLVRRLMAFGIDVVILAVLMTALWALLFVFGLVTLGLGMPLLSLLPVAPPLYHFLFLAGPWAATPGQMMMDLVVRRDADLRRPDTLEALISVGGFYLTLALGAFWLAVALLTTRNRTLHDLVSGLVVVRRDMLSPLTTR